MSITRDAMSKLRMLMKSGTKDEIQTGIEALNEISRPYAERVMDEAINKVMKGKNIME